MITINKYISYTLTGNKNEFNNVIDADAFARNDGGGFIEHFVWKVGTPGNWELVDSHSI